MKYLNASSSVDQHELAMRATLEQLGAWVILQCFCHRQMNGGKITNCHDWPDETWQRLGLTRAIMHSESPLWHFSKATANTTLVVHIYDVKAEDAYKKKQRLGKVYADKRWQKTQEKKIVKISDENGSPIGSPNGSAMGHPMRKEGSREGISK